MTGINWVVVRRDLIEQPFVRGERSTFLGTCFSLYPSGKYWSSFNYSNVDQGEIDADLEFMEQLHDEAEQRDLYIFEGDDPCDIFVGEADYR